VHDAVSDAGCGPFVDQLRQDFWAAGACKCDTRKALDFPTLRFGTRMSVSFLGLGGRLNFGPIRGQDTWTTDLKDRRIRSNERADGSLTRGVDAEGRSTLKARNRAVESHGATVIQ